MKKTILFIALILLANSFNSCKKDSDNEQKESFRLKEIIVDHHDSNSSKIELFYNDNKLSKMDFYEETDLGNWEKMAVSIIAYQAETITVEITAENSDYQSNFTYTFNNNFLTNYREIRNTSYDNYYNVSYEYTNQLLSKKETTNMNEYINEYTYVYNNEFISEIHYPNSNTKRIFEYSNSEMSAYYDMFLNHDGEWDIKHTYEFIYDNGYLKTHNFLIWNNPNNIDATKFNYDNTGLLSSIIWDEVGEVTFISEEGESNIGVFIQPDNALYPYPEYYSFVCILDDWFY